MRKLPVTIFALLLIISCKHKKNLSEQLSESFANHLRKIDSLVTLDSVHIIRFAPVNQRLGIIIDDSIYRREFMRIQARLLNAQQNNDKDSIEFYQYEINNLEKGIDSVTKSIDLGDTTHNNGYLINCFYYITKNGKQKIDSTLVFIDSTSTLRYTEFIDSSIIGTIKKLN
jgi:hypothetical protein